MVRGGDIFHEWERRHKRSPQRSSFLEASEGRVGSEKCGSNDPLALTQATDIITDPAAAGPWTQTWPLAAT